jgi:hypothetical protein
MYITNNIAGSPPPYNYNNSGATTVNHLYTLVAIPNGAINLNVQFDIRCAGESGFDFVRVYLTPSTVVPVARTQHFTLANAPTEDPLNTWLIGETRYNAGTVSSPSGILPNSTNFHTINIPVAQTGAQAGIAGTSRHLVFSWINDGSAGDQPPASIDNITMTYNIATPEPSPAQLIGPANNSTAQFASTTLRWAPGEGFAPTSYQVFLGTTNPPTTSVYTGPLTTFAPTLNWGTTYFWRVVPTNASGTTDTALCPVWTFSIRTDPTITTYPHLQNFDGVTAPALPLNWGAISNSIGTSWRIETVTTAPVMSTPNHLRIYNDGNNAAYIAYSPPILDITGKRMKFWYRASSSGATLQVGSMSDPLDISTFHLLQTVTATTTYTEFIVPLGGANGPHIAFRHGNQATFQTLFIDDVLIENLPAGADFRCLVTSINFGQFQIGTTGSVSVPVENLGSANLQITHPTLPAGITVNGFPQGHAPIIIGPGLSANLNYVLSPVATGTWNGTITMDTNATNALTHAITATAFILPQDITQIGTGTLNANVPIHHFYRHSFSQSIYTQDDFSSVPQGAFIQHISYQYNGELGTNGNPLHRAVRIWMGWTTQNTFPAAANFVPISTLEMVYEGMFNVTATGSPQWVGVPLMGEGFHFSPPSPAHNLVICMNVYLENTAGWNTSANAYRSFATGVNRSIVFFVDGTTPVNQNSPTGSNSVIQNVPNLLVAFDLGLLDEPSLSINPEDEMPFGLVHIGLPMPSHSLRIRNNGNVPLTINSIVLGGPDAADWNLSGDPIVNQELISGEVLPAITVSHNPTTTGTKSATITITDSRGGAPTVISLSSQVSSVVLSQTDLPYIQNFDSVTPPALPIGWGSYFGPGSTGAVVGTNLTNFSPPNSLHITSGSVLAPVLALSRPIEDLNTTRVRFRVRPGGANYNMAVGYITNNDGTTWTHVQTIPVPVSSVWTEEQVVSFAGVPAGTHRIAFRADQGGTGRTLNVDNIIIETIPGGADFDCLVNNINFGGIPRGESRTRVVQVRNRGLVDMEITHSTLPAGVTVNTGLVVGHPAIIVGPGLTVSISYHLSTATLPTGVWIENIVMTTNADNAPTWTIAATANIYPAGSLIVGDGEVYDRSPVNLPIDLYYRYTYSQTIYTVAEMGTAAGSLITHIGYHYNGGGVGTPGSANSQQVSIYMAETTQNVFATTTSWVPMGTQTNPLMTLVYQGLFTFPNAEGFVIVALNEPFYYTGDNNLVIGVVDAQFDPTFPGINHYYKQTLTPGVNRSIWYRTDTQANVPNIWTPQTANGVAARIPNTIFFYESDLVDGASLHISPAEEIVWGNVTIGLPIPTRQLNIRNNGTEPVVINSITLGGTNAAAFSLVGAPAPNHTLASGDILPSITINHNPTVAGPNNATLTIVDNRDGTTTTVINLSSMVSNVVLTVADLPYTQNFDGVPINTWPLGWGSFIPAGNTADVAVSTVRVLSTPNGVRLANGNNNPATAMILSRPVDGLHQMRMRISVSALDTGNTFQVGYITGNDGSTFVPVQTFTTIPIGTTWEEYLVSFTGAPTTGTHRIAITGPHLTASRINYYDNFTLELAPVGADFDCQVTSINFGAFPIGSTGTVSVPVSNQGTAPLNITHPTLPPGVTVNGLAQGHAAIIIGPGATSNLIYTLTPTTQGAWSNTITMHTNATNAPTHAIAATAFIHPPGFAQIGNGTILNSRQPLNLWYGHTFSQAIYTQADLAVIPPGAMIQHLSYQYNGITSPNPLSRHVRIWMGWTTQNTFAAAINFVPVSSLTQVYEGLLNITSPGSPVWVGVPLDGEGFDFSPPSPAHNLVICMNVYQAVTQWNASTNAFLSFASGSNRSMSYYIDLGGPINHDNPTATTSISDVSQNVPNIQITFEEPGFPRPRSLTGTGGFNIVNLNWLEPNIRPDSDITLTGYTVYRNGSLLEAGIQSTEYIDAQVFNGITYNYYVVANYEDGDSNPSNTVSVAPTGLHLDPPARLALSGSTASGSLTWLPGTTVLYESFETGSLPGGWLNIDADEDGNVWEVVPFGGREGIGYIQSNSFSEAMDPLFPENWLISPEFYVPMHGTFLSYWVGPYSSTNRFESYQVMIANPASTDVLDFVPLSTVITLEEPGWVRKSHSLNDVQDNEIAVRIAFVHRANVGQNRSALKLDGVSIVAPTHDIEAYPYDMVGYTLFRNDIAINSTIPMHTTSQAVTHVAGWNHYWVSTRYWTGDAIVTSFASNVVSTFIVSDIDETILPNQTRLGANYPNPFNPETTIHFTVFSEQELAEPQQVTIDIFNIKGQHVRRLVDGAYQSGDHRVVWTGTDDNGRNVGSGVYFYRMTTDNFSATKKMILMK